MGFQMTSSAAKIVINLPVTMRAKPTSVETSGTASDYSVMQEQVLMRSVMLFLLLLMLQFMLLSKQMEHRFKTGQSVLLRSHSANFFLGFSAELL